MFSDTDRQPVSSFVRDLWTSNPRVASALTGQTQAPAAMSTRHATQSGQLDLFTDQPGNVKALFGQRS